MIKRGFQYLLLVVAVVALPLACKGREEGRAQGDDTQTIAPAEGRAADTSTADMTQTVELQDGRSEAEGGVLSNPNGPADLTTAAPAVTGTSGSAPTTATTRTQ